MKLFCVAFRCKFKILRNMQSLKRKRKILNRRNCSKNSSKCEKEWDEFKHYFDVTANRRNCSANSSNCKRKRDGFKHF